MSVYDRYHAWVNGPSSVWCSWYLKAVLQGVVKTKLWVYFTLAVVGCTGGGVWYKLIEQGLSVDGRDVLVAVCTALPSLIGTTMLDYLLEEPKPSSVLWIALFAGVVSLVCVVCAYRFGLKGPAYVAVVITLLVAWAIKGRDIKFACESTQNNAVGGDLDNDVSGRIGEDLV